ncbi:hypothetical protein RchiOBHm_Chr2g0147931 [Rosa chinensis]|uniref:Uncharacterized protein n=1 Tax=Rosa chinensis TaxID=74649 RepID=A0A2P6RZ91_ROSCH|nr:hypothetical protein RchiOBHm_Chr2g0147931 [Rosa chinensis]
MPRGFLPSIDSKNICKTHVYVSTVSSTSNAKPKIGVNRWLFDPTNNTKGFP